MTDLTIGSLGVALLLLGAALLTMALHAQQVHGFFSVPVDHLTALGVLAEHFQGQDLTDTVVVSPDLGNAKTATYTHAYAESGGYLTLLSDGKRLTGAHALGPEATFALIRGLNRAAADKSLGLTDEFGGVRFGLPH